MASCTGESRGREETDSDAATTDIFPRLHVLRHFCAVGIAILILKRSRVKKTVCACICQMATVRYGSADGGVRDVETTSIALLVTLPSEINALIFQGCTIIILIAIRNNN